MAAYGSLERRLARLLARFPALKQWAKWLYTRLNYARYAEPGFTHALHPQVALRTPEAWAGVVPVPGTLFFGYYDLTPWSADGQRLLMHRHASTAAALPLDAPLDVLVFDRAAAEVRVVGQTRAWSPQQASMAQWRPGTSGELLFNDVASGRLVTRIVSDTGAARGVVGWPVQALHPDGRHALSLNYKRLHRQRPEYGYAAPAANFDAQQPQDGLWSVDLDAGAAHRLVSLRELRTRHPRPGMAEAEHRVNHAAYAPRGQRAVFLHRWSGPQGTRTRLYALDLEAGQPGTRASLRLLLDDDMVSHYAWLDDRRLVAWARTHAHGDRYYVVNTDEEEEEGSARAFGPERLGQWGDGHPTVQPADDPWLVTDSYPDRARQRHVLAYHPRRDTLVELGRVLAPLRFDGPVRCDLHPRWSPDGGWLSIDSAHDGRRRSYLLDVREILF
jgi:hypothetical protein